MFDEDAEDVVAAPSHDATGAHADDAREQPTGAGGAFDEQIADAAAATRSAPRPSPRPAPERRPVELVFVGVPDYHQASMLERAVSDLAPGEEIDVVEFEGGQLVLGLQAADLETLAERLVAASPASLALVACADDRATFRYL